MPTFGERLKAVRERQQWTQPALSAALGHRGNSTVSEWETRDAPPTARTVARLAKALGVAPEELLEGVPTFADVARSTLAEPGRRRSTRRGAHDVTSSVTHQADDGASSTLADEGLMNDARRQLHDLINSFDVEDCPVVLQHLRDWLGIRPLRPHGREGKTRASGDD